MSLKINISTEIFCVPMFRNILLNYRDVRLYRGFFFLTTWRFRLCFIPFFIYVESKYGRAQKNASRFNKGTRSCLYSNNRVSEKRSYVSPHYCVGSIISMYLETSKLNFCCFTRAVKGKGHI